MLYFKIETDYSPSITGKRNGGNAVEIKEKESFYADSDKELWKNFYSQEFKNGTNHYLWGTYVLFNREALVGPIRFCLTGKCIKQLDFMTFAPYMRTLQFLISERVWNIIKHFNLQTYNIIPAKIDTFEQRYYLLGFPTIDFNYYDFDNSLFMNYNSGRIEYMASEESYTELFVNGRVKTSIIKLNTKFNVDIIHTPGGTFFSSRITDIFSTEKISGYLKCDEILEN